MRKIYPPPFNKFVVFVFYGILSIAVIVSAQGTLMDNVCIADPLKKVDNNRQVIGYVQPGINPNTIRWELFNYINFIVNDINNPGKNLNQINALINAKGNNGNNGNNVKILLSIRNYDLTTWNDGDKNFYGNLVDDMSEFIISNKIDGVDIEYPGMRGIPCNKKINDAAFAGFIRNMKGKLPNKTIMLTVGSRTSDAIIGLNEVIDLLNIETYHFSLYENPGMADKTATNIRDIANPNSPYEIFFQAYNAWWGLGISRDKIIMGVDFGNTFQLVPNRTIMNSQTVEYFKTPYEIPLEINNQLTPIKSLCSIQTDTTLYSWPWKKLSAYALDSTIKGSCMAKPNWTRKFDNTNYVPWLFETIDPNIPFIFYVSYEDFSSLHYKLTFLTVGGVSISDISYDDDNNSLLNFIRGIPLQNVDLPPLPPKIPNSGKGSSPSNTTDSINADDKNHLDNHKANAGVIVGAVLGGLLLILVSCFVWYRRRSILNSKNGGAISKSSMRSHTTTKNVEMSCDPSPNRFAVPTTVIPVACGYVTAMFDFEGKEENDLSFKKGDKIEVLERGDGPNDWWVGRVNNTVGEFPGNYVKETG